jgi:uncharacterized membrane protein
MDYGLVAYFIFAAVVAFVLHLLSRRFFAVSVGVAMLCSIITLWYSAWVANYNVNIGWAPVILVVLFVYALPVALGVGLAFLILRRTRRGMCKPVKKGVMDEV